MILSRHQVWILRGMCALAVLVTYGAVRVSTDIAANWKDGVFLVALLLLGATEDVTISRRRSTPLQPTCRVDRLDRRLRGLRK
jgi:hypothetical protein